MFVTPASFDTFGRELTHDAAERLARNWTTVLLNGANSYASCAGGNGSSERCSRHRGADAATPPVWVGVHEEHACGRSPGRGG